IQPINPSLYKSGHAQPHTSLIPGQFNSGVQSQPLPLNNNNNNNNNKSDALKPYQSLPLLKSKPFVPQPHTSGVFQPYSSQPRQIQLPTQIQPSLKMNNASLQPYNPSTSSHLIRFRL